MGEFFILLLAGLVIAWALKQYKAANPKQTARNAPAHSPSSRTLVDGKTVRLTDAQYWCLSAASSGKTIYSETPKFKSAQMPLDSVSGDPRTVESLVKRGFLKSDGKAGYVKTEKTDFAIRSSMGF